MRKRPRGGRVMVWVGMAMVFTPPLLAFTLGSVMPSEAAGPLGALLVVGLMVWIVGLFRRAGDAANRLAEQQFSWCRACGYPFDPRTEDHQWVQCPECGRQFRAGEEREWLRIHPERIHVEK
ncbi:MAG: hypothetical protein QM783_06000 [Phycisphaerales bacterium]